jgi:Xaa-Pro aminopeptidase
VRRVAVLHASHTLWCQHVRRVAVLHASHTLWCQHLWRVAVLHASQMLWCQHVRRVAVLHALRQALQCTRTRQCCPPSITPPAATTTPQLPARVQHMAASASAVLFDFDRHTAYQFPALRSALHDAAAKGRSMPLRPHMHRLRWVKSPAELRLMRASAAISAHAVRRCMALSHAGVHEGALALEFEYAVRRAGAARLAYPTVAGGGPDACTIHYSRNDKAVQGGQLLLMDAGAEFHGYVSDVTRTWPVAGIFSAEQRALYEAVLRVRAR